MTKKTTINDAISSISETVGKDVVESAIEELRNVVQFNQNYSSTAISIPQSTWTEIFKVNVEANHVYLISYGAWFATNANGRRSLRLFFNGTSNVYTSHTMRGVDGGETAMLGLSYVIAPTVDTEISLRAWQNSNVNLNVNQRYINITRLK